LIFDKPKDEHDDDDNDEGFVTPPVGSRKTSDDYIAWDSNLVNPLLKFVILIALII